MFYIFLIIFNLRILIRVISHCTLLMVLKSALTVLTLTKSDLGKQDTVHFIPTIGFSASARRLHPVQLQITKQEFDYVLEKSTCRPSKSNQTIPLHIFCKETSNGRLTRNYRTFILNIVQYRYPIPHIQDFKCFLKGEKIFSKVDLIWACHQIPVPFPDTLKTAIITPFGSFEFPSFLNFGLPAAAQMFQHLISYILRDLSF